MHTSGEGRHRGPHCLRHGPFPLGSLYLSSATLLRLETAEMAIARTVAKDANSSRTDIPFIQATLLAVAPFLLPPAWPGAVTWQGLHPAHTEVACFEENGSG